MTDSTTRDIEVWAIGKAKIEKEFKSIVAARDLDAAIVSYRHLCKTSFPAHAHEQFAILLVRKLNLSLSDILKLCKLGGDNSSLYPDDGINHRDLRFCFLQQILSCATNNDNKLNSSNELFDELFDLIFARGSTIITPRVFTELLCQSFKVSTAIGNRVLEKLKKTSFWSPVCSLYARVIQGDCSLVGELMERPFLFCETIQLLLELRHYPQNVQFLDEIIHTRIQTPTTLPISFFEFGFEYLVECVLNLEKTKQLQFLLTRTNNNSNSNSNNSKRFAQMFVDKVKIGDYCHLDTFHSDFKTIDALVSNNFSTPIVIDRLFPKNLLSADESLLRLSVRNRTFTLQSDGDERLSRIRRIIDDVHEQLLRGQLITPLRELTLNYF